MSGQTSALSLFREQVHTSSWAAHSQCLHHAEAQSSRTLLGATLKEHSGPKKEHSGVLSPHITAHPSLPLIRGPQPSKGSIVRRVCGSLTDFSLFPEPHFSISEEAGSSSLGQKSFRVQSYRAERLM